MTWRRCFLLCELIAACHHAASPPPVDNAAHATPAPAIARCIGEPPACAPDGFAGAVAVIDVCATWANPCQAMTSTLRALAEQDRDVHFLQILSDVAGPDVEPWRTSVAGDLPVIGGDTPIAIALHADNVPTTYVYDRGGNLQRTLVGMVSADRLTAVIAPLR